MDRLPRDLDPRALPREVFVDLDRGRRVVQRVTDLRLGDHRSSSSAAASAVNARFVCDFTDPREIRSVAAISASDRSR